MIIVEIALQPFGFDRAIVVARFQAVTSAKACDLNRFGGRLFFHKHSQTWIPTCTRTSQHSSEHTKTRARVRMVIHMLIAS